MKSNSNEGYWQQKLDKNREKCVQCLVPQYQQ